jgi:hypothetical protein
VTLSEFLLARIAEDEWVARMAWADSGWLAEGLRVTSPRDVVAKVADERTARFIAANSPAHILAECEAKRRIVEIATAQIRLGREARGWDNWEDMAGQTLRALALPFADHPDYRDEWKP